MSTSFIINVAEDVLTDLHRRLASTRWPDAIINSGWDYGTDLHYLQDLCRYWQKDFDWRKQEKSLNAFSHYRTEINGFGLHYIYEKGKGHSSIPLLLTHGYPDSFIRFLKIIPLLIQPDANGFSFDVIVPSLPGFGFSDSPSEKGMNPEKIADLFARLMTEELGYKQFAAHGGDWGSSVTEQLVLRHPDLLTGIHLTDIPYRHILRIPPSELSEAEKKYIEAGQKWQMTEGGYAMIQASKPQTLAYAMNDSPPGLAAWIIEKFRSWSDCHGDIENRFSKDELLTNIMIYWITQTAASAFRIYYESMQMSPAKDRIKPKTPVGVAIFPKDIITAPRDFAERIFNVKRFTQMPEGGHFAAMETPALLANDMREFFSSLDAANYAGNTTTFSRN
ncbi:MAG: multidrug transporter [Chitinophagaceae bacterium]|nr:multidrug transporter [Chitinophagaceae bacterium]